MTGGEAVAIVVLGVGTFDRVAGWHDPGSDLSPGLSGMDRSGRRVYRAVTLTDQATGVVAVQAAYTVAAQTPGEAVAAWGDLKQPFAVLGVALGQWRLGEKTKARELAQSLLTSNRFVPDVYGARLLFYAIAMNNQDYPQAVAAAQALIDARRTTAGQMVQPIDHVNLINALIGACRIDQARAALVEALGEYPNVPAFTTLSGDIEKARQRCP